MKSAILFSAIALSSNAAFASTVEVEKTEVYTGTRKNLINVEMNQHPVPQSGNRLIVPLYVSATGKAKSYVTVRSGKESCEVKLPHENGRACIFTVDRGCTFCESEVPIPYSVDIDGIVYSVDSEGNFDRSIPIGNATIDNSDDYDLSAMYKYLVKVNDGPVQATTTEVSTSAASSTEASTTQASTTVSSTEASTTASSTEASSTASSTEASSTETSTVSATSTGSSTGTSTAIETATTSSAITGNTTSSAIETSFTTSCANGTAPITTTKAPVSTSVATKSPVTTIICESGNCKDEGIHDGDECVCSDNVCVCKCKHTGTNPGEECEECEPITRTVTLPCESTTNVGPVPTGTKPVPTTGKPGPSESAPTKVSPVASESFPVEQGTASIMKMSGAIMGLASVAWLLF